MKTWKVCGVFDENGDDISVRKNNLKSTKCEYLIHAGKYSMWVIVHSFIRSYAHFCTAICFLHLVQKNSGILSL